MNDHVNKYRKVSMLAVSALNYMAQHDFEKMEAKFIEARNVLDKFEMFEYVEFDNWLDRFHDEPVELHGQSFNIGNLRAICDTIGYDYYKNEVESMLVPTTSSMVKTFLSWYRFVENEGQYTGHDKFIASLLIFRLKSLGLEEDE
jgi:hypothetical protein